uniref:Uncharacterized protein n=1 Tax=Arundo donax TaxID=35708 RepID=A0A0A9HEN5_ARUDO
MLCSLYSTWLAKIFLINTIKTSSIAISGIQWKRKQ